jgi:cell division septal protein FtsQ
MSVYRNTFIRTTVFFVSISIFSFIAYWFIRTFFVIQTIEISGDGISVIVDEKKISKNLLFFPTDKIREDILKENQLLEDVIFRKKFPHTLVIAPVLRHPFAILRTSDRVALIDSKGYVLEYGDLGKVLPTLSFANVRMTKGEKIANEKVLFAIQALSQLQSLDPGKSVTEPDGPSIEIVTEKYHLFLSKDVDLAQAIATLQTLIAGFRIKGTLPSVVDLRFDKPVVHF